MAWRHVSLAASLHYARNAWDFSLIRLNLHVARMAAGGASGVKSSRTDHQEVCSVASLGSLVYHLMYFSYVLISSSVAVVFAKVSRYLWQVSP